MEIRQASSRDRAPRKKLKGVMVMKGKGGGHVVEHHFHSGGGAYHEPEPHPFGEGQGQEMLAHVGKMMGVESEGHEEHSESEKAPQQEEAAAEGHETGPEDQDTEGE